MEFVVAFFPPPKKQQTQNYTFSGKFRKTTKNPCLRWHKSQAKFYAQPIFFRQHVSVESQLSDLLSPNMSGQKGEGEAISSLPMGGVYKTQRGVAWNYTLGTHSFGTPKGGSRYVFF